MLVLERFVAIRISPAVIIIVLVFTYWNLDISSVEKGRKRIIEMAVPVTIPNFSSITSTIK